MNDGQHCRHFSFLPSPDFHIHASPSMTLTPSSSLERSVLAHRALVFRVTWDARPLDWLLAEFRLLVNESIRIALREDIRSRARLTRAAYADLSARHTVHKQYIPSAFEVALAILKVHRRRIRKGKRSSTSFLRRLMLKAENQSYWLDRETGRIRIPIRGTEGVQLHFAALRVAPLDPRRLVVGPRIPHGCPGEGYRRPEEGGAQAVRAPRRDRLGHERGLGKGCTVPARCPPP